jgi:hypothetical protein
VGDMFFAKKKKVSLTRRDQNRAEQANIDRETVREILGEDLGMRRVCAKMVSK